MMVQRSQWGTIKLMNHGLAQVGKLFKEAREKLDLSQSVVASRLNERLEGKYLHTTIGKIENGRRNITLEEAVQLSDILHIQWDTVFSLLRQRTTVDYLNDSISTLNLAAFDCATSVQVPLQNASEMIKESLDLIDSDSETNGFDSTHTRAVLQEISEAIDKLEPLSDLISSECLKISSWIQQYVPKDQL